LKHIFFEFLREIEIFYCSFCHKSYMSKLYDGCLQNFLCTFYTNISFTKRVQNTEVRRIHIEKKLFAMTGRNFYNDHHKKFGKLNIALMTGRCHEMFYSNLNSCIIYCTCIGIHKNNLTQKKPHCISCTGSSRQCCGSGSGRIRKFLVGSGTGSGRL
jgi:hypothetical protein